MNSNATVLKKNKDFVSRAIGGETMLLPIYKSSKEMDCIYSLNAAAAWLWGRMDGKTSLAEIKRLAAQAFSSDAEDIAAQVDQLAGELLEIKAAFRSADKGVL